MVVENQEFRFHGSSVASIRGLFRVAVMRRLVRFRNLLRRRQLHVSPCFDGLLSIAAGNASWHSVCELDSRSRPTNLRAPTFQATEMADHLPTIGTSALPSEVQGTTTTLSALDEWETDMTTKRFRSVLLFGPPGVGKGTQGGILGTIPGFFHLSVGDVFRSIDIGSPEGELVCKYSSKGQLVPDELTIKIWKKALNAYIALSRYKPREDLLVLDGMPRNSDQAKLVEDHLDIQLVVNLHCSDEEDMIHRIRRRAIRENRQDDGNENVIRNRFEVYRERSAPLLEFFDPAIIKTVDANGSPAEVLQEILSSVIPIQNHHFDETW